MSHRPRPRLLLLTAGVGALALMPPAHADGFTFTYSADQGAWSSAFPMTQAVLEPAVGRVTLDGSVRFRPPVGSFRITLDDAAAPAGARVPVSVWQRVGKQGVQTQHCVPVDEPYDIPVRAGAWVSLYVQGATLYPWHPCGVPATAGTGEIEWG